jgi:hypothetical protein
MVRIVAEGGVGTDDSEEERIRGVAAECKAVSGGLSGLSETKRNGCRKFGERESKFTLQYSNVLVFNFRKCRRNL